MIWLAGQVWPFLLLAAALGAVLVVALSTRRVTVERWVTAPVHERVDEPLPDVPAEVEATEAPAKPVVEPAASPFPTIAAAPDEPAPWEKEELWSRPVKPVSTASGRGPQDEWADAAQNWRTWADEATGRAQEDEEPETPTEPDAWRRREVSSQDHDLFAADRDAETHQDPFPHAEPLEASSFRYDQPVDTPLPRSQDPFPFATPVEAPSALPPTDPFPAFAGSPAVDEPQGETATPAPPPVVETRGSGRHRGSPALEEPEPVPEPADVVEPEVVEPEAAEPVAAEPDTEPEVADAEVVAEEQFDEPEQAVEESVEPEPVAAEPDIVPADFVPQLPQGPVLEPAAEWVRESRPAPQSPYGPGSAFAPYDGTMPKGFPVKGSAPTMLYHPPRGRFYSRTIADVWFDSEASAEAAGFTRWDRRATQSLDVGLARASDDDS